MNDPHLGFIVASYAIGLAVIAGLIDELEAMG